MATRTKAQSQGETKERGDSRPWVLGGRTRKDEFGRRIVEVGYRSNDYLASAMRLEQIAETTLKAHLTYLGTTVVPGTPQCTSRWICEEESYEAVGALLSRQSREWAHEEELAA